MKVSSSLARLLQQHYNPSQPVGSPLETHQPPPMIPRILGGYFLPCSCIHQSNHPSSFILAVASLSPMSPAKEGGAVPRTFGSAPPSDETVDHPLQDNAYVVCTSLMTWRSLLVTYSRVPRVHQGA